MLLPVHFRQTTRSSPDHNVPVDEFLTGERTLRSDVLDRLATAVGFRFQPTT
jgi:hypothetical protein